MQLDQLGRTQQRNKLMYLLRAEIRPATEHEKKNSKREAYDCRCSSKDEGA